MKRFLRKKALVIRRLDCTVFGSIPDGFLERPAERLADLLPGPCLIDLPGRQPRPLFVSVLLHGNEDTGLVAVQEVLRRHPSRDLGRSNFQWTDNAAFCPAAWLMFDKGVDDFTRGDHKLVFAHITRTAATAASGHDKKNSL
jgi:hypothetical protein